MQDGKLIWQRVQVLLAEQRTLVRALLHLRGQLQGSLFVRYGRCGKPACACQEGKGHGPYYVLSSRRKGRGSFSYLSREEARAAREQVARYGTFRKGLRQLQRLNEALVRSLRRYQEVQVLQGGRRLGLKHPPAARTQVLR